MPWSLCDGLFTMPAPPDWRYRPSGYTDGAFELPSGSTLSCEVASYEAPEQIESGSLTDFAREPGQDMPELASGDVLGNVLMFAPAATDPAAASFVWKSLDVLDASHIRVARFDLTHRSNGDRRPTPEEMIDHEVTAVINHGRFADRPTPLDRVAPSKDLKRIVPYGIIHIRVPEHWRYERVEDGRYACDVLPEQRPPDPTLWFNVDAFDAPYDAAELAGQVRDGAAGFAATLGPPDQVKVEHDAGGSWIEAVQHGRDEETELIDYIIHRHVCADRRVMIAQFSLLLTTEDDRTEAGQEIVRLMHREIRNAIVLPRRPGEEAEPAPG